MTSHYRHCFLIWALGACLCLQLISSGVVQAQEQEDDVKFDYYSDGLNGPTFWGGLKPTGEGNWSKCSTGAHQSPVTITSNITVTDHRLGDLDAQYKSEPVAATISINEGSAVEVELAVPKDAGNLTIDGITYIPKQFHFHMGSEHKILGRSFPMELHLVHDTGVPNSQVRAVIAWLFVKGPEDNPFLAQFADKLPSPGNRTKVAMDSGIKLPKLQQSYARYKGSLTTPPCTEDVTWTVMLWNFPTISERQIKLFKAAMPKRNARPSMPSNGRSFSIRAG